MIPLIWMLSAYAFSRMFDADSLYQVVCYGALFCLSGTALASMDAVNRAKINCGQLNKNSPQ